MSASSRDIAALMRRFSRGGDAFMYSQLLKRVSDEGRHEPSGESDFFFLYFSGSGKIHDEKRSDEALMGVARCACPCPPHIGYGKHPWFGSLWGKSSGVP